MDMENETPMADENMSEETPSEFMPEAANETVGEEPQGEPPPPFYTRRWFWQRKFAPAFWTVTGVISITVNIILIVILLFLGKELFTLKDLVTEQLIGGLHQNFVAMDEAHITTTITVEDTIVVEDTIPVVFDLMLQQNTDVILTEKTSIEGATIFLNNTAVPLDLDLPAGTALGINLDLVVPVSQTVPVLLNVPISLDVPVDIALEQTQLHEPFVGLQEVVGPYNVMLSDAPNTWGEAMCATESALLCALFGGK